MNHVSVRLGAVLGAMLLCQGALAAPVLMSDEWGVAACDAWNANPTLTGELAASGWAENEGGKGYKLLQVYRSDCSASPTAELRIALVDGEARCVMGGRPGDGQLDSGVDYVMHATTERWLQMGAGDYGPMRAMTFGRLKFDGPKWEAMKNMGPFENFLLLVGVVESDSSACP